MIDRFQHVGAETRDYDSLASGIQSIFNYGNSLGR